MVLLCDLGQVLTLSEPSWFSFSGLPPPLARHVCFSISPQGILFPAAGVSPTPICGCFPGLQRGQARLEAPDSDCCSPPAAGQAARARPWQGQPQALPPPARHSLDSSPGSFWRGTLLGVLVEELPSQASVPGSGPRPVAGWRRCFLPPSSFDALAGRRRNGAHCECLNWL